MHNDTTIAIRDSGFNLTEPSGQAFTLVELLIVIAIIAILAALLLPSLARSGDRARMAKCLSNHRQIGMAFQMYRDDHETKFPAIDPTANTPAFEFGGGDPDWSISNGGALAATNRPLWWYAKSSELFHCPADHGLKLSGGAWPTWFEALGTSYKYNYIPWVPTQTPADPVMGLAGKPENWIANPSRHILMNDPPAMPDTLDNPGSVFINYSHYARQPFTVSDFGQASQRSIAPILFVDGHALYRDFTRQVLARTAYLAEPTPEWAWYEAK